MNSENILKQADLLRQNFGDELHDKLTASIYSEASAISERTVSRDGERSKI